MPTPKKLVRNPPAHVGLSALPAADPERLRETAQLALAASTRRAYAADWRAFTTWCVGQTPPLPMLPAAPETVALYLDARAAGGARVSTIERALTGIGAAHRVRGLPNPCADARVHLVLAAIRRKIGAARRGKAPVLPDALARMSVACPESLKGVRDRAILVLGFHGAFRRAEICALRMEEISLVPPGAPEKAEKIVWRSTRPSKANQEGAEVVRIFERMDDPRICPVACLRRWLAVSGVADGFLFRRLAPPLFDRVTPLPLSLRGDVVRDLVLHYGALAGLDPGTLGGHSLRAGFVTSARLGGAALDEVAAQTGHASLEQVAQYDRRSAELRPGFSGALARAADRLRSDGGSAGGGDRNGS